MKKRLLAAFLVSLILSHLVIPPTPQLLAKPILKPRKYHGPIPQRSLTLGIGFVGGADNEDMWTFFDVLLPSVFRNSAITEDFGSALQLDLAYTVKVHPQFAFRFKGGAGFLGANSEGLAVSDPTLVRFTREFDVTLLSLEASGLYYFQDASVEEFQVYLGGGFSMYFPVTDFDETVVDEATGQPFPNIFEDRSDTTATPGVHAILGVLYHVRNSLAFTLEARVQLAQSKFEIFGPTLVGGVLRESSFDVDYTGFVLDVGVSRFF